MQFTKTEIGSALCILLFLTILVSHVHAEDPKTEPDPHTVAASALKAGDMQTSFNIVMNLIQQDPLDTRAYDIAATILLINGGYKQLVELADKAERDGAWSFYLLEQKARAFFALKMQPQVRRTLFLIEKTYEKTYSGDETKYRFGNW